MPACPPRSARTSKHLIFPAPTDGVVLSRGVCRRSARRGGSRASELRAPPRYDDLLYHEVDDRRGGDGDERANRAAKGPAYEDRDEHEERMDLELIALDERGDHVPLQVLDHDGCNERQYERPRAVERGDREERNARKPAANQGDQLSEGYDHGERDREGQSDHDQREVREHTDDRHHDGLRPQVPDDPQQYSVEDEAGAAPMIGMRQRQDEVSDLQPVRQEEERDEEHCEHVDEDREDIARKRGSALACSVEDRVSEARQLLLERRQRREVRAKLGVCLTDSLVALGVLGRALGKLD